MLQQLKPERALVRNAADPKQLKYADRVVARRHDRLAGALRAVLESPEGRLFCWELLSAAGIFRSIWRPSAEIHYLAGRQDFGHELLADFYDVDIDLYLLMEREARIRAQRDASETEAAHTPASTEKDTDL